LVLPGPALEGSGKPDVIDANGKVLSAIPPPCYRRSREGNIGDPVCRLLVGRGSTGRRTQQRSWNKLHTPTEGLVIMTDTNTRVALVTGGTGGIGRAVIERLAKDGFAIAVHYAGNKAKADETVAAVQAQGGAAISVGGDVADEHAMAAAFDAIEREFGGIDVVVNTAGIMLLSPIATLDLDDLDRMHRTNIRGTFVVSQQAARRLRGGGELINF
jgi:lactate dehydrogenase-like 2-hydroxyacid dehydrogenase